MSHSNPSFERNETSGACTRRKFLIAGGTVIAGLSLSGCSLFSGTKSSGGADDLIDDALRAQMSGLLDDTCQWITTLDLNKSAEMWANANLARVLTSGYKISNRKEYLDKALNWLDFLVSRQRPITTSTGLAAGYWGNQTGPGEVYLADTGTAMASMMLGYKLADRERRKNYLAAMERFARFVRYGSNSDPLDKGRGVTASFIIEDGKDKGALGCGYYEGHLSTAPYIISTSLTKVEFFSLLHSLDHDSSLKPIIKDGVRWLLAQQLPTGEFPYILDNQTAELYIWPLDTLTYVSEGLIAAYLYLNDSELRRDIAQTLKGSVEWLLRTQNEDGSWGKMKSPDQQRSPGCVVLLAWYYRTIEADPRIAAAVRKYGQFLLDPTNQQIYGFKKVVRTTSFIGLVLADLVKPNVTFE